MRQNKRTTLTPQQAAVQRRQHALAVSLRGVSPSGRLGVTPSGRLGGAAPAGRLGSVVWGNGRRRLGSYINNNWPTLATQKIPYALTFDPVWGAKVGPQLSGMGDTVDTIPPDTSVTFPIVTNTSYPGSDGTLTVTTYGPPLLPNTGPGGISIGNQRPPQQQKQPGFFDQLTALFSKPLYAGSSVNVGTATAGGLFLLALAGMGSRGRR